MQNFCYENEFYLQVNETQFHMKGFALSLTLKQRLKATWKWPISSYQFYLRHKGRNLSPTFQVALTSISFPESAILFVCAKDLVKTRGLC